MTNDERFQQALGMSAKDTRDFVRRICTSLTQKWENREDFVQIVMERIWKAILAEHRPWSPKGWIATITYRTVMRERSSRRNLAEEALPDDLDAPYLPSEMPPQTLVVLKDALDRLWAVLDPRRREVLQFSMLQLTQDEIAALLKVSKATINNYLSQIRESLRDLIDDVDGPDDDGSGPSGGSGRRRRRAGPRIVPPPGDTSHPPRPSAELRALADWLASLPAFREHQPGTAPLGCDQTTVPERALQSYLMQLPAFQEQERSCDGKAASAVERRPSRWPRVLGELIPLAMAASVIGLLCRMPERDNLRVAENVIEEPAGRPEYIVELGKRPPRIRGVDPSASPTMGDDRAALSLDGAIDWVIRPLHEGPDPVVRVFLHAGSAIRELTIRDDHQSGKGSGGLRISCHSLRELVGQDWPPGDAELLFVIGTSVHTVTRWSPEDRTAGTDALLGVQVVRKQIRLEAMDVE